jgi:CDGSH-type Zn-finger protein
MTQHKTTKNEPVVLKLEAGTYYWCTCGMSNNQPFCDGSHSDLEFEPLVFEISEPRQVALCQCGHTRTPPFCDGSHANL